MKGLDYLNEYITSIAKPKMTEAQDFGGYLEFHKGLEIKIFQNACS